MQQTGATDENKKYHEDLTWEDDPVLEFSVCKYSELSKLVLQQIKYLVRGVTAEKLKVAKADNLIFIAYKRVSHTVRNVTGIAMIHDFSPMYHFSNENATTRCGIPYLYNYIFNHKYKPLKASVSLMYFIKRYLLGKTLFINLDVLDDNKPSVRQFFKRNGFISVGEWEHPSKQKYNCFTYSY